MAVLLRNAHQVGDDLERQLGGDLLHEVGRAGLADRIDDRIGRGDHLLLEIPDHPRSEPLVHQTPIAGVHRRVHVQHHHPLLGYRFLVHVHKQGRRPVGGEMLVVTVDTDTVVVPGHRPEPFVEPIGVGMPVDRRLVPEVREPLVGDTLHEVGGIAQVDVRHVHGFSPVFGVRCRRETARRAGSVTLSFLEHVSVIIGQQRSPHDTAGRRELRRRPRTWPVHRRGAVHQSGAVQDVSP